MKLFSYYQTSSRYNKKIVVRTLLGKSELLVNGIQQTGGYTEKLWKIGLRGIHAKNVLVFGVGGGLVFKHFPQSEITAVDIDGAIIKIATEYFGVRNVTLIERDARVFDTDKKFDLVIVDLYIGNDVPEFATTKNFLLRCERFLKEGGRMIINYYCAYDQGKKAAKIVSFFEKAKAKQVLRNIFIYVVK